MDAKRVLLGVDFSEYSVNVILESKYVFRVNVANGLEGEAFACSLTARRLPIRLRCRRPKTGILTNS